MFTSFVLFKLMVIIHSVLSQIGTGILYATLGVQFMICLSVRGQHISLYSRCLSVSPIDCKLRIGPSIRLGVLFTLF